MKLYKCGVCKTVIENISGSDAEIICCGQKMNELIAGSTDAAVEKHVPDVTVENNIIKVQVGSVEHPMTAEHYIEWIAVETENGVFRKNLKPDEKPYAEFIADENSKAVAVYAYCNLHGLWKKDI